MTTESRNFPYIVTFYSFKGGVGRSLALINVAFGLIKRGRNVLVLDMDLEAPGISGFLSRNKELARAFGKDAIDLLGMAIMHARDNPDAAAYDSFFADVGGLEYAVPIAKKKLDRPSIQPRLGIQGRLDVIGVRPDGNFIDRLTGLELGRRTNTELQLTANALRAYLKTRRIAVPPLPGADDIHGTENKPVPYDYVLVDARTGFTDPGGLCIGPLSDRLVVLTGLNDQNVIGTRDFLKHVGLELREWFTRKGDKPWDSAHKPHGDDPDSPRGLGPKPTIIVASPVPAGEIELREQRLDAIEKKIGPVETWIPYHPLLGLFETIFVRDYPDEQVSVQYDKPTDLVLAGAMDDPMHLYRRWSDSEESPAELPVLLRLAVTDDELAEWPLSDFASGRAGKLSERDINRIYTTLTLTGAKEREKAFVKWGDAFVAQAKTRQGEEADRLFEQAYEKCQAALKIKPDDHEAFDNWGGAFIYQGRTKQGQQRTELLREGQARLLEGERVKEGSCAFNLACAAALMGQVDDCRRWLLIALKHGELTAKLMGDSDLDSVRELPWFQEILAALA